MQEWTQKFESSMRILKKKEYTMRECDCDSSVGLRDIFKLLVQNLSYHSGTTRIFEILHQRNRELKIFYLQQTAE